MAEMEEMYMTMIQPITALSQKISLDFFLSMAPLVILLTSVMEMYVILLLCQITLTRLNIQFPGSFHIATMHLSRKTGLILVVLLFGSYVVQNFIGYQSVYLSYAYTIAVVTFALQGLSFLSWLLIMKEKPRWMILVFIGILIPMVNSLYVVVGIIDIFSDLRANLLYNGHSND